MGWSIYRLGGPCMNGLDLRTGRTVGRFFLGNWAGQLGDIWEQAGQVGDLPPLDR